MNTARVFPHSLAILPALLLAGAASGAAPVAPTSGVERAYFDTTVRPQDDLAQYANGGWLAKTAIPADKTSYGINDELDDATQVRLRGIIEGLDAAADPADPDQRKIADLYASFVDEAGVERIGLRALEGEFARIKGLSTKSGVVALIGHLNRIGVVTPLAPTVHQDAHDSATTVYDLAQDGLGLPDRDYYLPGDAKLHAMLVQYRAHVARMLGLAGDADAAREAKAIVDLETALARAEWTKVAMRDPVKAYNKLGLAELAKLAPAVDWPGYLAAAGVAGKVDTLVIGQPSYIAGLSRLLRNTPLPVWKAYLRWHLLSDYAPYLSAAFVNEHFAFYGKALRGTESDEPRWKRGVRLVDAKIGEGLGRQYVRRYFPPESKARIAEMVASMLAAYRADIETLDWMGPATRQRALDKIAHFTSKIGYPDQWRDYSALRIARDDLAGNVMRANEVEFQRNLDKLGRPVDRNEWGMTPPTNNAYYDAEKNEIVFPAGILQPPFFDSAADDAANYGSIGATIGHEISHGFDDEGSQYDGAGNLLTPPGWFTQADLEKFTARTRALVAQYGAYVPVPGYPVNGELTLGENIADNSGLAIAYKAYRLSLGGREAPVIDGLTGDQRFFLSYAQGWRSKTRQNQTIIQLKSDPHSPDEIRALVPERNLDAFYSAFDVKPGDRMYLAPEKRVTLW